jgi:hypothetical protein
MTKLKLLVIIFSLGYSSYMGSILFTAFYEIHKDNQQQVQTLLNKI